MSDEARRILWLGSAMLLSIGVFIIVAMLIGIVIAMCVSVVTGNPVHWDVLRSMWTIVLIAVVALVLGAIGTIQLSKGNS